MRWIPTNRTKSCIMIIPSLNPLGRFGHQFHNYLSAFLVSKFLGADIAPCNFLGNASAWNDYIQFPSSFEAHEFIHFQHAASMVGNTITKSHLSYYYAHLISGRGNACVRIPVDQWAGEALMKLLPRYRHEILSMLVCRRQYSNQIAVHLRRGDVSSSSSVSLFMPDIRYIHAVKHFHSLYPLDWPICIYSEGSRQQFLGLAHQLHAVSGRDVILSVSESSFCINPCDDFLDMISSRVLFCSYSTYAYCAIYFSEDETSTYFLADDRSMRSDAYMIEILQKFGAKTIMPAESSLLTL